MTLLEQPPRPDAEPDGPPTSQHGVTARRWTERDRERMRTRLALLQSAGREAARLATANARLSKLLTARMAQERSGDSIRAVPPLPVEVTEDPLTTALREIADHPETASGEEAEAMLRIYSDVARMLGHHYAGCTTHGDGRTREHLLQALEQSQRRWRAIAGIGMDPERRELRHGNRSIWLSRREYQLLDLLAAHPGRCFSPDELIVRAWGDRALSREQLRLYVVRLRRHLAALGMPWELLNVPRRGYRLVRNAALNGTDQSPPPGAISISVQ